MIFLPQMKFFTLMFFFRAFHFIEFYGLPVLYTRLYAGSRSRFIFILYLGNEYFLHKGHDKKLREPVVFRFEMFIVQKSFCILLSWIRWILNAFNSISF